MKTLNADQIARLTLEELDVRIPKSLEKLQTIQHQLELETKDGSPMTDAEYHRWHDNAVAALRHQTVEYRRLKDRRHKILNATGESSVKLLQAALEILRDVEDLTAEDLLVCHRIELWLATRVKPKSGVVAPAADDAPADEAAGKPIVGVASR